MVTLEVACFKCGAKVGQYGLGMLECPECGQRTHKNRIYNAYDGTFWTMKPRSVIDESQITTRKFVRGKPMLCACGANVPLARINELGKPANCFPHEDHEWPGLFRCLKAGCETVYRATWTDGEQ